jgi:hypothetical protein
MHPYMHPDQYAYMHGHLAVMHQYPCPHAVFRYKEKGVNKEDRKLNSSMHKIFSRHYSKNRLYKPVLYLMNYNMQ